MRGWSSMAWWPASGISITGATRPSGLVHERADVGGDEAVLGAQQGEAAAHLRQVRAGRSPRMPPANCSKIRRSNFHCQPPSTGRSDAPADVVHHVVEVVVLGRHGAEAGQRLLDRRVRSGAGRTPAFSRYGSDLGVGLGDRRVADDDARRSGRRGRAAVAMVTKPPMLWPTTTGGPSIPPASATAHDLVGPLLERVARRGGRCRRGPTGRGPRTRNSAANVAATWVHQWAWAPPPWTNTRPAPARRRPRRGSGSTRRRPRPSRR